MAESQEFGVTGEGELDLGLAPQAPNRRQAEARQDASVHVFSEGSGNAGLVGRELPLADVLAADARLTALAKSLHRRGAQGTVSQLRAAVYTALLNRRPITALLDDPPAPGDKTRPGADAACRDTSSLAAGSMSRHYRDMMRSPRGWSGT